MKRSSLLIGALLLTAQASVASFPSARTETRMVYDARTRAGLTQADLARRVGTRQPAIARIEDADYRGHSLGLLSQIARALNLALIVSLQKGNTRRPRRRKQRVAG